MQSAHLTDGMSAPQGSAATRRQALVQRINALSSICITETNRAFHLGEGREADVVRLMMVDAGVHARSPEMDALRAELGLSDPVIPSLNELGELNRMLYRARDPGTASGAAAGG